MGVIRSRNLASATIAAMVLAACGGSPALPGDGESLATPSVPTDAFEPGPSSVPCTEDELRFERANPTHDGWMLGFSEVVVRASGIEVSGALRFLHDDGDEDLPDGTERVCQPWVRISVEEVFYEDYSDNRFGLEFPPLPEPPFVLTAYDTYGLVSADRGFDEVQQRIDDLVVGLARGHSSEVAPELGEAPGFLLTLLAAEDASEVFNPDRELAASVAERHIAIRDRLGADGVVDIVRAYRELHGTGRWGELFGDLYPPDDVDAHHESS